MRRRTWNGLVVAVCVTMVAGCSDDGGTGGAGGMGFTVLQTDPLDLAAEVSPHIEVTAVFNQPVDARSRMPCEPARVVYGCVSLSGL